MAQNPDLSGNFGPTTPGRDLVPIAPNDTTDLPVMAKAIRCRPDGTDGTLRFTSYNGQVRNTAIKAGETLIVMASRVHLAGTTATLLEAYI